MIPVVYWSQTGNTEEMAKSVVKGITDTGACAELLEVSSVAIDEMKEVSVLALGCPAMGDEVLEEIEMEPFVSELEGFVSGKTVGLFGSYGWGDGQWMRDWVERMKAAGAQVIGDGVMCQEAPDVETCEQCEELGKALADSQL